MALSAAQPSPWCRCRIRQMSRRCRGLRWLRQAPRRFRFRPCQSRVLPRSFQRRQQSRRRPRRGSPQITAGGPGGDRARRPLCPRRNAAGASALQPCARRDRQAPARGRRSRLRPQVQRLFESYVGDTTPSPGVNAAPQPALRQQAQNEPVRAEDACARDTARLARLRAEQPTFEAITKFEKELGCEQLRSQLRRLRESVTP